MLCSITQIFGIPCSEILTPFPNPATSVLFSLKQTFGKVLCEVRAALGAGVESSTFPSLLSRSVDLPSFRVSSQKPARGDAAGASKPESRAAGC